MHDWNCPMCSRVYATALLAAKCCMNKQPAQPDMVNSPAHYTGSVECIDAIKAATGDGFNAYLQGAAIKYLYRYKNKNNPKQDLEKAIWYINKLLQELEE